jgi:hypothetical protein
VDHKVLVPRGRARVQVSPGTVIRYYDHVFRAQSGTIEVPVVLSGEISNELEVESPQASKIRVRFLGSKHLSPGLVFDTSCSQTPLQIQNSNLLHSWIYVYCHTVHPSHESGATNRTDIELRWETEGRLERLRVNGVETTSEDGVTHMISHTPQVQEFHLEKGQDSLDLKVAVAERFHPAWISMGIGPYSHQNQVRAFPTIYAGYYFSEGMRLASFSAIPIKPDPEIDTGLYLVSEQFRGIDERIHMSLLLGAHVLAFTSEGKRYSVMSAPQGIELGFKDFLFRGQNLTWGGFFYPKITNRSYVNTWVRFGNGRLFYEFNFINWQEPTDSGTFSAKSMGVSVGFPLVRFF